MTEVAPDSAPGPVENDHARTKRPGAYAALGAVSALALALLGAVVFFTAGGFDVAATRHGLTDKVAPWVLRRSVAMRAKAPPVLVTVDARSVAHGLEHYRENCLVCHGAPGLERTEIARGMNPVPPPLERAATQRLTDAEVFWIVANGIRMSGMPAFGPSHEALEIAHLVAFVRQLPTLTPEQRTELMSAPVGDATHHDAPPRHGSEPHTPH